MVRQFGSPLHEELRRLLVYHRKKARLTQAELSKRLQWSQQLISKIETGEKRVTVVELVEIAEVLGFDPRTAVTRLMKRS
jgi:transcriptional regulator with XRE-family HTH domain